MNNEQSKAGSAQVASKHPLQALYDELNRITWEGVDEGWNLAIAAVQKRISEIILTPAPADAPRHPDFWRYEHIANGLLRRAEKAEAELRELRASLAAPTGAQVAQPEKVITVEPGNAFIAPPGYTVEHTERAAAPADLLAQHRAVIEEAAQVLESAAAHNRAKGRTVLERTQQDRADRLRLILATHKHSAQDGSK